MKKIRKNLSLFLVFVLCLSVFSTAAVAADKAEITKLYASGNTIRVKWNKVAGVSSYDVYKYHSGLDGWKKVKTVSGTSFTDKNIKDGVTYSYAVDIGQKQFGNVRELKFLKAPDVLTAKMTTGGVRVKWSKSAVAESYNIYRKAPGGSYKKLGSVSAKKLSFTDKTAKDCITYTYAVRAVSGNSKSDYSLVTCQSEMVKKPVLVSVKNSPKGVTISWKKNTAPKSYEIFAKVGGSDWKSIASVSSSNSSYIDQKAQYGKVNYYKIRAVSEISTSYCSDKMSVFALDPKKPAVALTWDDGPYSPVTNQILDTLEKYHSRATFFIVGSRADTYKDCIKREVSLGCEVGTHTYNHASLTKISAEEIRREMSTGIAAVEKYSGKGSIKLCRTPGGAVNDTVRANVGLPMINWSVDTLDWQHRTTSKTVSNIKSQVKDGSIVLMHDLYFPTGNAAVEIIPWLVSQGYQLVTVSELFELKGITPQAGQLYTHG